ncbi:preprotein translocase subunit SecE [Roseomonas sp. KE0001]|nr:preprotein translocase subunit SecE [Roseomonas sp. KE0001]
MRGGSGPETARAVFPRESFPRNQVRLAVLAKLDPAGFIRDVRQEVSRVTWPTRKETLITTGLVLALSALAAVFFLATDKLIQLAMSLLFGFGV